MYLNLKEDDKFTNGKITYCVLKFYKTANGNVALLRRKTYCPYVVALNIKLYSDGSYAWAFGHYFNLLENAYKCYEDYLIKFN